MIPKGYRVIGDQEMVGPNHKRWMLQAPSLIQPPLAKHLGFSRAFLLSSGRIVKERLFLEYMGDFPEFDGWMPIGVDVVVSHGDRAVKIKGSTVFKDPSVGIGLTFSNRTFRQIHPSDKTIADGFWCVYRKVPWEQGDSDSDHKLPTISILTRVRRLRHPNSLVVKPLPLP